MTDHTPAEVMARAIAASDEKPTMVPCPRCQGKGYHHGFGEDGHDPDWCLECGGGQYVRAPLDQAQAALTALAEAGYRVVPVDDNSRPFSDTILPEPMVFAGLDAVERALDDMQNYESGKTIDWDSGMIAVAVYRAIDSLAAPAAGEEE